MSEVLHVVALAAALVGAGSLGLMRRTIGRPELAAGALMVVGMTDAMTVALLPPIVWFAVMLPAALALAAGCRSPRAGRPNAGAGSSLLTAHLALGLVSTAALILLMTAMGPGGEAVTGAHGHRHGGGADMPQLMAGALGLGAIVLGAVALHGERAWTHRLHHVTMTASTVAMSAIVIL
ncbi:hypothetical protein ACI3KS_00620 [Microbacterium sp. ZW T5_45]|uniref:hypothetical protein n=1 Tax=Microbacterium sp. ZW T5_45 TaxID=3378080 RepID=UPI0038542D09